MGKNRNKIMLPCAAKGVGRWIVTTKFVNIGQCRFTVDVVSVSFFKRYDFLYFVHDSFCVYVFLQFRNDLVWLAFTIILIYIYHSS